MSKSKPDQAALSRLRATFDKSYGEQALAVPERKVISTGSLELDLMLGVGGLVQGRIYQSWGPESTAKSTMSLLMAAEQQKAFPNRMVGWVDMEQTYDEDWAKAHGVDTNQIWVVRPDSAEDVADQVKMLMESDLFAFIVLDSVGGMVGRKEFDKDADEATVGLVAKVVTRMVKMAAVRGRQHQSTLQIVNQVRAAIGSYGADTTAGGGWALKHVTSAQMKNRKSSGNPITVGSGQNKRIVGREFAVNIEKNKLAPPGGVANLTLFNQPTSEYGAVGLDRASEAVNIGKRLGLLGRSGAWYTLSDDSRHNGEDAVRAHLRQNPKMIEEIRTKALATKAGDVVPETEEVPAS